MNSRIYIFMRALFQLRNTRWLALAGAGIALFGDVVDFFTSLVSRHILQIGLAAFATLTLYLCWKFFAKGPPGDAPPDGATDCPECNATRFGIFATLAFGLLTFVGEGGSATGRISDQLGIIERDVSDIKEALEPQTIIDDPETMADHFNNAFLYHYQRNDGASAVREMKALYGMGAPNKMDAAQLYFDTHTTQEARAETLAEMERIGMARRDATLLVVAARHAPAPGDRARLVAQAQVMRPELPYAWWDPMKQPDMAQARFSRYGEEAARLRAEIATMEKFLALEAAMPPSRWFFMPTMGAGYSSSAQSLIDVNRRIAAQYDDMESGKFQRGIRDQLMKERASGN